MLPQDFSWLAAVSAKYSFLPFQAEKEYLDINGKKQYMPTKDYIKAELGKELSVRDAITEALADESENGIIPQFKKR